MWLSWKIAVAAAVACLAVTVAARTSRRRRAAAVAAFTNELTIVLGLYALWRIAGTLSVMNTGGAVARGRSIWHLEQALHLPSEAAVQRWVLPHSLLAESANAYYAIVHVPALIVFLLWMFIRHRDRYPRWRNALAVLTGACLAIQLVPVAPPRMFPQFGFVDTAVRYHQSVYGPIGSGLADQLSAMPSVHVGWATLIGIAVVATSQSRWRWLVLAHPLATIWVVTVTANHWWLDGIVAVALLAGALAVADTAAMWVKRLRRRPESVPPLAGSTSGGQAVTAASSAWPRAPSNRRNQPDASIPKASRRAQASATASAASSPP